MRRCSKCGEERVEEEFPPLYHHPDRRSSVCRACVRERQRKYRAKHRKQRREDARRYRQRNRERARARDREYNRSEKGQARTKKYRAKPESKVNMAKHSRDYAKRQRLKMNAMIPSEVIAPYLERMLREFQPPPLRLDTKPIRKNEGISALAKAVDIDEKMIRDTLEGNRKGMSVEMVDRLTLYGDFSLPELTDRAEEWALLTGSKWPEGYQPIGAARGVNPRGRSRTKRRKVVSTDTKQYTS